MHPAIARYDTCDDHSDLIACDIAAMADLQFPQYPEVVETRKLPSWGTPLKLYNYLNEVQAPINLKDLIVLFHDPKRCHSIVSHSLLSLANRGLIKRQETPGGIFYAAQGVI